MHSFLITKQGQALPNYKVLAENRSEAVKKAIALLGTRKVSVTKI